MNLKEPDQELHQILKDLLKPEEDQINLSMSRAPDLSESTEEIDNYDNSTAVTFNNIVA